MSRARWRQLATSLKAAFNHRPTTSPIPARLQLDLWAATDHRVAAQNGRTKWL